MDLNLSLCLWNGLILCMLLIVALALCVCVWFLQISFFRYVAIVYICRMPFLRRHAFNRILFAFDFLCNTQSDKSPSWYSHTRRGSSHIRFVYCPGVTTPFINRFWTLCRFQLFFYDNKIVYFFRIFFSFVLNCVFVCEYRSSNHQPQQQNTRNQNKVHSSH